jgi:hypothetical protein
MIPPPTDTVFELCVCGHSLFFGFSDFGKKEIHTRADRKKDLRENLEFLFFPP